MRGLTKITLGALGAVAAGVALKRAVLPHVEEARYEVEEARDDFELRRYAPRILAETVVQGGFRQSLSDGFRRLFRYITGENQSQQKIEMTAPVGFADTQEEHVVSFVMPAKYTMETLPLPTDDEVRVTDVPERRVAALCFSGRADERLTEAKRRELFEQLGKRGLRADGEPVLAQYNPPWTPSFLRRNEILVDIGEASAP